MATGDLSLGQMGLGAQGLGALMGVIGAFYSSSSQRAQLRAQAQLAEINAQTAERTAQSALQVGQWQEQRSMLATANLKSTQQAHFAANGVDLGEGSAARVIASTDVMGEIDKNTIAANAVRQAWGYRTQATNYSNEALYADSQASAISPLMSGAGSLLTGAGQVASGWYQLSKTGALPASGG